MNSVDTSLTWESEALRQSRPEMDQMFPSRWHRAARAQTQWPRRAVAFGIAALIQIVVVIAVIRAGYVTLPRLQESLIVVNIPQETLLEKAPPVTMPRLETPVVPIVTPVIDVASETTITVPPPQPNISSAATTGTGSDSKTVIANYQQRLLRHLAAYKRYPAMARSQRRQGVALVQFSMDRNGRVLDAILAKSSRCEPLDRESVELLQRASPLPAPPAEIAGATIAMVVPVEFSLQ